IVGYFVDYNHRVFKAADGEIDIFMMGDDIGGQTGPLISLDMWRKYFRNGFKTYIDIAHQYGIPVMYHTCGDVKQFIPDFIECGLDILQSLQPKATNMDIRKLKQEFGKDIVFQGGMDIQHVLPLGTPEDVKAMAKYALDSAKAGGGYIICTAHNIQIDTAVENVVALFEAYHEYGKY
ncbi:MAG: uroporphyrinogen decarboxylase family protein, partial [Syntrophobacteraceae bacterium]